MSGAFVAGNEAGLIYNEFPFMGEGLVPTDLWREDLLPAYRNAFEHSTMVQFNHRILAMTSLATVGALFFVSRSLVLPMAAHRAANALAGLATLQITLGISTLLLYVPPHLAATHQAGALALLSGSLFFIHTLSAQVISALYMFYCFVYGVVIVVFSCLFVPCYDCKKLTIRGV